jgi:hypothetical protein
MNWRWRVSYFFAGAFAANAVPHFFAGTMGRPFQSPFAKPPGQGFCSPAVILVCGFCNAVVAYLLLGRVGEFHLRTMSHIVALGMGVLLISLLSAHHLGQFHGGNAPSRL